MTIWEIHLPASVQVNIMKEERPFHRVMDSLNKVFVNVIFPKQKDII